MFTVDRNLSTQEEINPSTSLTGNPSNFNLKFQIDKNLGGPKKSQQDSLFSPRGISGSKYNINLPQSAFYDPNMLEKTRAVNQPFHHEMGRSLARMGAEILGGTLEGFGYLSEMAQFNPFAVDAENILIDWGKGLKDLANENMPIHNANPGGYMFSSTENFWEGFISLGSTLALLAILVFLFSIVLNLTK